jgi:hypothetical protein
MSYLFRFLFGLSRKTDSRRTVAEMSENRLSALEMDSPPTDELGYLFLPNCSVKVNERNSSLDPPKGAWLDVDVPSTSVIEAISVQKPAPCSFEKCRHCDLLLAAKVSKDGSCSISLHQSDVPYFDGTMSDRMCAAHEDKLRSDASLLTGMAFSCQSNKHIVIRRVQILFKEPQIEDDDDGNVASLGMAELDSMSISASAIANHKNSYPVALLITFAMPQLTCGTSYPKYGRSVATPVPVTNGRSRKSSLPKALPPSTQLLLSMLRSDWDCLDREMKRLEVNYRAEPETINQLEHDGSLIKAPCPVFPPKLSLEELYHRIKSASKTSLHPLQDHVGCPLRIIPEDVLMDHLAPFLRARSLDALRCSCTYLHRQLRSVVPGLKLRLYEHQVRSLEWMRKRETHEHVEQEMLQSKEMDGVSFNGDLHRTVTGGATTCLRLRHSEDSVVYRVNQYDGRECALVDGGEDFVLSRRVARGGLLCDDPGLGKTITVLSLILQTFGLSTVQETGSNKRSEDVTNQRKKRNLEKIFSAYWREHVPDFFKRQLMNRLLGEVRKADRRSYFFEPDVDPLRDGVPDYLNVIDRPMSFQRIAKILEDEEIYLRDFYHFEDDINLTLR